MLSISCIGWVNRIDDAFVVSFRFGLRPSNDSSSEEKIHSNLEYDHHRQTQKTFSRMKFGGLLINRRTNRQYRVDGCRRSKKKPLLKFARPFFSFLSREQLPDVVDLRSLSSPIEEQYTMGSCVGNALASIMEFFYCYSTGAVKRFSRLFIYYNARMLEDEYVRRDATENDSGADLQYAIISLMQFGCCEEMFWPFEEHLINIRPNENAYIQASQYRLHDFSRLTHNIQQLRQCLAQGYPFVMAIRIYSSFASNHRGYIPLPKSKEKASQYRHAVVCVGYIHSQRLFIIRNSHGTQWGDRGYGYLPYDYVMDEDLTKDLWALKSIDNIDRLPAQALTEWQPKAWKSEMDLADDRSVCDLVYSNDEDDEDDRRSRARGKRRFSSRELSASPLSFDGNDHDSWQSPPVPPAVMMQPIMFPSPPRTTPMPIGPYSFPPPMYF